jgi:hypothetical protein
MDLVYIVIVDKRINEHPYHNTLDSLFPSTPSNFDDSLAILNPVKLLRQPVLITCISSCHCSSRLSA